MRIMKGHGTVSQTPSQSSSLWPQIAPLGHRANLEFVSAYPNKALGFEDIVAAITGDALANVLARCGWDVTREFYVNDAGLQADAFARALYARLTARQSGSDVLDHLSASTFMQDLLEHLSANGKTPALQAREEDWLPKLHNAAVAFALEHFRTQLSHFGIALDVFRFESALMAAQNVEATLRQLYAEDAAYDVDGGQVMLATSRFGDRQDRPLKGADGSWTYFMSDVVYHRDKISRGFAGLFTVFRADHAAYQERILATIRALGGDQIKRASICVLDPIACRVSPQGEADLMAFYTPRQLRWIVLSHPAGQPFELTQDEALRAQTQAVLDRFDAMRTDHTDNAPDDEINAQWARIAHSAATQLQTKGLCDFALAQCGDQGAGSAQILADILEVLGL